MAAVARLRSKSGPGYLELPFSTQSLWKGLVFLGAGVAAYFIEQKLEPAWKLAEAGFYVLKGIYLLLFAGAFACLAFHRVVRLEVGRGRIVVRKGIRFFGLVPVYWSYECDELRMEYVKGRAKDGSHVKMSDFWRIRGVRSRETFLGRLFSELAIYSKGSDAADFMTQAGDFMRNAPLNLPPPSPRSIQLVSV